MYSRRAETLLQLARPRAAVADCSSALRINPDSGKAFKIRARAQVRLKRWTDAHRDFQEGLRIDYDDATYSESLTVAAKAKEMQAVATGKRVKDESAKEAEAARNAQRAAELAEMQRKAKDAEEMQKAAARLRGDPYVALARKQGWFTDFMGAKRGKCQKCKRCEVYCWRPVRMNS